MKDLWTNPLDDYLRIKQLQSLAEGSERQGKPNRAKRFRKSVGLCSNKFKRLYGVAPEEWDINRYCERFKEVTR